MPFIKPLQSVQQVNFLASQNFQAFTTLVTKASVPAVNGKNIIKAGTPYPANDATAKGILLHDVDVTFGDQPASLIVAGWVLEARLPVTVIAAAKTALKDIRFQ